MIRWQNSGLASARLNLHGLNPQIIPKDSQALLTSQNTTKIHQDSPSDTPRHPQIASDTIGTTVYLQKRSRLFIWCIIYEELNEGGAILPFWQNSEMKDLFHLIIMRHQNT